MDIRLKISKISYRFIKLFSFVSVFLCNLFYFATSVFAAPPGVGSSPSNTNTDTSKVKDLGALYDIADIIMTIFTGVGIVILIYAIGELVLASRNENPEGRHNAIIKLVVAIIIISMRVLAQNVLNVAFKTAGYEAIEIPTK